MASSRSSVLKKDEIVQAIVIADTFGDEFIPISNDIPLALLPVINKPLIDYTLEFLSLGGVGETFLFCCSHVNAIKTHIKNCIERGMDWTLAMKVNIIVSESCRSFGDCLRDIDAKGLLRGSFVLVEPGTISNIKLLPLVRKHNEIANRDKGAAMTVVFQDAENGQIGLSPDEEVLLAFNNKNRVLFHKKTGLTHGRKIDCPLEVLLENPCIRVRHNLKDTHIAICSSSVLPLFSDNFDFQTKDDFVRGLLINEEILGMTIYCHITKGSNYGGAVTSWRMYHALSRELHNKWISPLQLPKKLNHFLKNDMVVHNNNPIIPQSAKLSKSVLGENVTIGNNVEILDSFILSNAIIGDNVTITHSVIGPNSQLKSKSKVTAGSIIGKGVVVESGQFIENSLVQSTEPEDCDSKDKLGKQAFRLRTEYADPDEIDEPLAKKFSRLHVDEGDHDDSSAESDTSSDSNGERRSYSESPVPDDTHKFFTEVVDSLTRGFEDELQCDNLILEINSSRYAYNVTVQEVNFFVIKSILMLSLSLPAGAQYFSQFVRLLSYFSPILTNYIRNDSAMQDALEAVEDVAVSTEKVGEKWVMFVLKWFYDKDYISEDSILIWSKDLDSKSKFHSQVKPFTDWLLEAEEETSSDEETN